MLLKKNLFRHEEDAYNFLRESKLKKFNIFKRKEAIRIICDDGDIASQVLEHCKLSPYERGLIITTIMPKRFYYGIGKHAANFLNSGKATREQYSKILDEALKSSDYAVHILLGHGDKLSKERRKKLFDKILEDNSCVKDLVNYCGNSQNYILNTEEEKILINKFINDPMLLIRLMKNLSLGPDLRIYLFKKIFNQCENLEFMKTYLREIVCEVDMWNNPELDYISKRIMECGEVYCAKIMLAKYNMHPITKERLQSLLVAEKLMNC